MPNINMTILEKHFNGGKTGFSINCVGAIRHLRQKKTNKKLDFSLTLYTKFNSK